MSLVKLTFRKQTGAWTLEYTETGPDGRPRRVQKRCESQDGDRAEQERARKEVEIWERKVGIKRGDYEPHTLEEATVKYIQAKRPSLGDTRRIERVVDAVGKDTLLEFINQDTVTNLRDAWYDGEGKDGTVLREIVTPLRAILTLAHKRKWCAEPMFEELKEAGGRIEFFTPAEAELLIANAANHLKPLLIFLFCTGARLSEALYLDWRDCDPIGGWVIFWDDRTKTETRRDVLLPPRAKEALLALPHRAGMVFRTRTGEPYERKAFGGGQIKTGWNRAIERAGLRDTLTPHKCRHSWATWHMHVHQKPLLLMQDGGWSSLKLVLRYGHLMKGDHAEIRDAILSFRGETQVRSLEVA